MDLQFKLTILMLFTMMCRISCLSLRYIPLSSYSQKQTVSPFSQIERNDVPEESPRFARIDRKLRAIEDALISEAINLIEKSARKGSQEQNEKFKIKNRLNAAHDIEDARSTINNLRQTIDRIESEDRSGNQLEFVDIPLISEERIEKKSRYSKLPIFGTTDDRDNTNQLRVVYAI